MKVAISSKLSHRSRAYKVIQDLQQCGIVDHSDLGGGVEIIITQTKIRINPKENKVCDDVPSELDAKPIGTFTEADIKKQTEPERKEPRETDGIKYSEAFELFWTSYPKVRRKNKGMAYKCWKRINPSKALQEKMLCKLESLKKSEQWTKDRGQYIPLPSTWLNSAGWDDDSEDDMQAALTSERWAKK